MARRIQGVEATASASLRRPPTQLRRHPICAGREGGEQDLAQPLLGRYLVVEAGHDQPGWEAVVYREELAVHPPATIARVRRGRLPWGSQP